MSLFCFVPNCKNTAAIPFLKDSNSVERCWKLFKVHAPNSSSFLCVQHYNDIRRYQDGLESSKQYSSRNLKIKSYSVGSTESVLNAVETNELNMHTFVQQNHQEVCGKETDSKNELLDCKAAVSDVQNNLERAPRDVSKLLRNSTYGRENIGLDQQSFTITVHPNEIERQKGFDGSLYHCDNMEDKTSKIITANISSNKLNIEKIVQINQNPSINDCLCEDQLYDSSNDRMVQVVNQSSDQDSDCKEDIDVNEHKLYESDFDDFQNGYIIYDRDKIIGTFDNHVSFNPEIQSRIDETSTVLPEEKEHEYSFTEELQDQSVKLEKCRLCMREQADTKNVFTDYLEDVPIYLAIESCLSPIQICRTDKLSKRICLHCWVQLKSYFNFRETVLQNDKTQRKQLSSQTDDNHKRKNDSKPPLPKKIKIGDTYLKKMSVKDDTIQPSINWKKAVGSNKNKLHAGAKGLKEEEKLVTIEDELQKVLRDNLPEEQASAENIIIHVQNDSEFHNTNTTFIDVKDPDAISDPIHRKTIITGDGTIKKSMTTPARILTEPEKLFTIRREFKLPKSESKISNSTTSYLGIFKAQQITYIYDTEFCLLDGYLFEYRLHKEKRRTLKCILPTCHATAVQQMWKPNVYKEDAEVLVPHNHERGSETDRKKQMFFSIMRRKLQSDKGINFKSIYETACEKDPFIRDLVPLKSVILEVCRNHAKYEPIYSFEHLSADIEGDHLYKLQFTLSGKQFYQNQFMTDDSRAILFANLDIVEELSSSKLMYVDGSFKIDTSDKVDKFQLVTVLIWLNDSYYPAIFVLINKKTQAIYKKVFQYIHDTLAPNLRPADIVTDYEANLYYALGEIYVESCIGGSVFYFTQNLYKKICTLELCKELETNAFFRNVYHMLLMLPLLPVNTILDGLSNLEIQSKEMKLFELMKPLFQHVRSEWIEKVTPDLFCVHRLENRINENVMAPFKKLRDLLLISKGKVVKPSISLVHVVEKLIELENYLQIVYSDPSKKYFSRDLSSTQKKNVLKAWHFIESHPKININTFFSKVLGYIKCMENQLWIWGFYRYTGGFDDELISSSNFSIVANEPAISTNEPSIADGEAVVCQGVEEQSPNVNQQEGQVVVEGVIDVDGSFVLQGTEDGSPQIQNTFLEYVCDT